MKVPNKTLVNKLEQHFCLEKRKKYANTNSDYEVDTQSNAVLEYSFKF